MSTKLGCSSRRTAGGILVAAGERGLVPTRLSDDHAPPPIPFTLPLYILSPANTSKQYAVTLSGVLTGPGPPPPDPIAPASRLTPLRTRSRATSHRHSNTTLVAITFAITFDGMPSPTYKELTSAGKSSCSVHSI